MSAPAVRRTVRTGTLAARPAATAVAAGDAYLATDTGQLAVSNGVTWTDAGDAPVTTSEQPLYFDFSDPATFARGWTVAAGVAPTVAGGVALPPSNAELIVVRTHESVGDAETVSRITMPATIIGGGASTWSVLHSYIDPANFLMLRWNTLGGPPTGQLEIWKRDLGTFTNVKAPVAVSVAASTTYWMVTRIIQNTVGIEWWTADPSVGGTPAVQDTFTLTGGDATKFGAGVRGRIGLRHASAQTASLGDFTIRPLERPPRQRDVQIFTSTGGWVKPAGCATDPRATVRTILVGGGAGAGSGARVPAGVQASGGGGGGGGPSCDYTFPASLTQSGTVTVGAGGPGGPAVTTDNTVGVNGTNGFSTLAAILTTGQSVRAGFFANAGGGGQTPGNSTGGAAASGYPNVSSAGAVGTAGSPGAQGGGAIQGGTGGGSGGGLTTGTTPQNGGAGGFQIITQGAISGGVAPGGAGVQPGVTLGFPFFEIGGTVYRFGYGGSGGASAQTGPAGAGGNGQSFGGGGGGGGASRDTHLSGAGGSGAPGIGIIITEWGG